MGPPELYSQRRALRRGPKVLSVADRLSPASAALDTLEEPSKVSFHRATAVADKIVVLPSSLVSFSLLLKKRNRKGNECVLT